MTTIIKKKLIFDEGFDYFEAPLNKSRGKFASFSFRAVTRAQEEAHEKWYTEA